jgi:hypothetical protein
MLWNAKVRHRVHKSSLFYSALIQNSPLHILIACILTMYRMRQANFLFLIWSAIWKRKLACRTLYFDFTFVSHFVTHVTCPTYPILDLITLGICGEEHKYPQSELSPFCSYFSTIGSEYPSQHFLIRNFKMKITIFWDSSPCILEEMYRRFRMNVPPQH